MLELHVAVGSVAVCKGASMLLCNKTSLLGHSKTGPYNRGLQSAFYTQETGEGGEGREREGRQEREEREGRQEREEREKGDRRQEREEREGRQERMHEDVFVHSAFSTVVFETNGFKSFLKQRRKQKTVQLFAGHVY